MLVNAISTTNSARLPNLLLSTKFSTIALMLAIAILVVAFSLNSEEGPSNDWKVKNWLASRRKPVIRFIVD